MNEGMIRVAPLLPSRQVLARMGVNWGDLLAECGLRPDLFDHPDNPIAFGDLCRFVSLGATASRCEHFGLLLAHESGVSTLGAVGLAALKGNDVGSVLRAIVRNLHLHDQGAVPFLTVDGGKACLGYLVADYHPCGVSVVIDAAVGIIHRIVGSLCGPNWRPLEVGFARRQPRDVAPYIEFFGVPLNFDATYTGLIFKERDLHKRVQLARPAAAPADPAFAAAEQASVPFPILIRRLLQVLLVTERCTVADAADLLDMHRRTLNRRLQAMGVTFRDLADEAAYVRSRQLLAETDMSLAKIANAMGYAEVSTFSRRFCYRSGIPPGQWRKQFRHDFVVPS